MSACSDPAGSSTSGCRAALQRLVLRDEGPHSSTPGATASRSRRSGTPSRDRRRALRLPSGHAAHAPRRAADGPSSRADRFYGKYRGLVLNNQDPSNLGRLQATRPRGPRRDPDRLGAALLLRTRAPAPGFFAVPPVGAGVWIEFEAGDVSRPIWSGAWWAAGEVPMNEQGVPARPETRSCAPTSGCSSRSTTRRRRSRSRTRSG